MDLIDRNAVLNRYQEICNGTACMDCPFNKDGCALEKLILESAVVDAEPVVRCKDCYFCGEIDEDGWHWCQCTGAEMPKDGFCPHAVRK